MQKKTLIQVVVVFLIASLVATGCAGTGPLVVPEAVLPADHPLTQANNGQPVFVPVALDSFAGSPMNEVVEELIKCPTEQVPQLLVADLPKDAEIKLCTKFSEIMTPVLYVSSVASVPAAIEPGPVGETFIGVVIVGGKVVAFVTAAVVVGLTLRATVDTISGGTAINQQMLTSWNEAIAWSPATAGALPLPGSWNRSKPEEFPREALENTAKHAIVAHWAANCVILIAKTYRPDRVYYAMTSPRKHRYQPTLMFAWDSARVLDEGMKSMPACVLFMRNIAEDFKMHDRIPALNDIWFTIMVGQGPFTTEYYMVSAYATPKWYLSTLLCDWNYTFRLFPVPQKAITCGEE